MQNKVDRGHASPPSASSPHSPPLHSSNFQFLTTVYPPLASKHHILFWCSWKLQLRSVNQFQRTNSPSDFWSHPSRPPIRRRAILWPRVPLNILRFLIRPLEPQAFSKSLMNDATVYCQQMTVKKNNEEKIQSREREQSTERENLNSTDRNGLPRRLRADGWEVTRKTQLSSGFSGWRSGGPTWVPAGSQGCLCCQT